MIRFTFLLLLLLFFSLYEWTMVVCCLLSLCCTHCILYFVGINKKSTHRNRNTAQHITAQYSTLIHIHNLTNNTAVLDKLHDDEQKNITWRCHWAVQHNLYFHRISQIKEMCSMCAIRTLCTYVCVYICLSHESNNGKFKAKCMRGLMENDIWLTLHFW